MIRYAPRACLALLAGTLGGCPLPQPLPSVGNVDGTSGETPPRIVVGSVSPPDAVVIVRRGCPGGPRLTVSATIRDDNVLEQVEARWFVDYTDDPFGARPYHLDTVPPPEDPAQVERPLPPLVLQLPENDLATLHVLELVVSNGFYALDDPAAPLRNRSAQPGFETQLFRWVFVYGDARLGRCSYP